MIIWPVFVAALSMLLLTALCLFWPRKTVHKAQQTVSQQFEERLQLLALARDSGELAEQDFDTAAHELKSQFSSRQQTMLETDSAGNWRLPLVLLLLVALLVAAIYSVNGHYQQLAAWQQAQQQLQQFAASVVADAQKQWQLSSYRTRLSPTKLARRTSSQV